MVVSSFAQHYLYTTLRWRSCRPRAHANLVSARAHCNWWGEAQTCFLGSIPTPAHLNPDEHCTNVWWGEGGRVVSYIARCISMRRTYDGHSCTSRVERSSSAREMLRYFLGRPFVMLAFGTFVHWSKWNGAARLRSLRAGALRYKPPSQKCIGKCQEKL